MRRRTPVAALVVAAALLLSSPSVGSGPVSAELAAEGEAAVCQAPVAAPQRSVEAEIARLAAEGRLPADQDVVILNGRGYNYGAAPDKQLGMIRPELQKAEAELHRR